jgi:phosphomannomutase
LDGLKIYFRNGGWITARFSGTEPLLRIFSEMSTQNEADEVVETMKAFLGVN